MYICQKQHKQQFSLTGFRTERSIMLPLICTIYFNCQITILLICNLIFLYIYYNIGAEFIKYRTIIITL